YLRLHRLLLRLSLTHLWLILPLSWSPLRLNAILFTRSQVVSLRLLLVLRTPFLHLSRSRLAMSVRLSNRTSGPWQLRRQILISGDRARKDCRLWLTMVLVEELMSVLSSIMLHSHLRLHRRNPLLVQYANLCWHRTFVQAVASSVEADAITHPPGNHNIVHHHWMNVHIVNHVDVYAIDRCVVEKMV